MPPATEENSLKDQMRNVLEEARMILPGVQALFGFQTIAVFNQRFVDMGVFSRYCHLAALMLVVVSIGLVMAPAAWHRLVSPSRVTAEITAISSKLISWALVPLALAVAMDVGVVIQLGTEMGTLSVSGGLITLAILALLWFIAPLCRRRRDQSRERYRGQ